MKTKINPCRLIFSLLFALSPYLAFSTQLILTPDNLQEVLAELSNRHHEDIDIPMAEVEQFLEQSIAGVFDPSLLSPEPEITEMDDVQIAFAWPAIANANNYVSRYLNLENGDFNSMTSQNPAAQFTIANHFFMYTFQATSNEGIGIIWIIIHDKPIAIGTTFDDCQCDQPHSQLFTIKDKEQVLAPIFLTPNWSENYSIHLSFFDQTSTLTESVLLLKLESNNSGSNHVYTYSSPECTTNITIDQNNIYALAPGNNQVIQFSFTNNEMKFKSINPNYNGTLSIKQCTKDEMMERISNAATTNYDQIFPNPGSGRFTINLNKKTYDNTSLLLLKNATGKTLKQIHTQAGPQLEINLSPYPNGTYYLQVVNGLRSEVYPIVKID